MTDADFDDDRDLNEFEPVLRQLDDAFESDLPPVPDRLRSAASAAFGWRVVDEQLAELLFDSTTDLLTGVRGGSTDRRSFRYRAGDALIRVHLTDATLIVTVEPAAGVPVRIVTESGATDAVTDEHGELVVDAPGLPFRLEIDAPGGRVVTPWTTA